MEATALTNHIISTFSPHSSKTSSNHNFLLPITTSLDKRNLSSKLSISNPRSQSNRTVTACVASVNGEVEETVKDVVPISNPRSQFNRTVTVCVASVNGGVEETVKDIVPIEKQFPAYPTVMGYYNKIREILPHRFPFLLVDKSALIQCWSISSCQLRM